ncbi:MAG: efflux RND transporter periplasmic adaptor subunit [Prevotellaceae bacterium]|nr:efflux RND transporter periplasmic adaptor subunit [Prevotellaceae bacterium]
MKSKRIFHIIFHNRILLTAVSILCVIILAIIVGLCIPQHKPTIEGQLESTDYRVSTKVPSRVVKLLVSEGDYVHAGDTLAILSAPEVNAMEQETQSREKAAGAGEDLVKAGSRKEAVSSAYYLWQQAIAARDISLKTYRRMSNLYEQGVVSEQKRDEAKSKYEAAVAAAQAMEEQYNMSRNGSRNEEKVASEAVTEAAGAKVKEVRSLLNETVLTAPQSGWITEIFVEVGEFVGTGAPVMNVETNDYWFSFFVTEDKLRGIDYHDHVRIYRPATGDTVSAYVTRINNAGDFAAWKATRALNDIDLKLFEVRMRADHPLKSPHGGESAVWVK